MVSVNCMRRTSEALFHLGQLLSTWGIICFSVSLATAYWVVRPSVDFQKQNINPNQTMVTTNYGIFMACRQTETDSVKNTAHCGSILDNLKLTNTGIVKYIQFVMCVAVILYAAGVSLEILQCLPIDRFRNFVAKNRMVELFAGIATVMVFHAMVIFAGEVKSKAERVPGQDEETAGWSFAVAVTGIILCAVGLLLVIMFRELPVSGSRKKGGSWLRPASKNSNVN